MSRSSRRRSPPRRSSVGPASAPPPSTTRSSSLTRKRVLVSGRVQGVFFRDTTRRRAESAGVAGWVRNTPDGAVEAVFEGDAAAVEEMVAFCRRGPGRAEVASVEVEDEEPEGLPGFTVR